MLINGLVNCMRAISFRMFPIFPQLQVAVPVIQRTPLAITNGNSNGGEFDLAKWIQESFLQFAAPKKRVPHSLVVLFIGFYYEEKTPKKFQKLRT